MRKYLIAAIVAAFAMPAIAADVPPQPYKTPTQVVAYDPFAGWALIGEVGYGQGKLNPDITGIADIKPTGIIGGVGIQYQSRIANNVYAGLRTVLDFSGLKDTITPAKGLTVEGKTTWLGRTTVQVGMLLFPNMLVYVDGGVAYGNNKATITFGKNSISDAQTSAGWTAGAGVDWAINQWIPNSTIGLEYIHVDLGKSAFCFSAGGGACIGVNAKDTNDIFMFVYKYKYGS